MVSFPETYNDPLFFGGGGGGGGDSGGKGALGGGGKVGKSGFLNLKVHSI